jgi:hypothetical protein
MLTYSQDETQPCLTLTGPQFSASKSGHRSFRKARTVLAATASERSNQAPPYEGLKGLQRRFTRVDAPNHKRAQRLLGSELSGSSSVRYATGGIAAGVHVL